MIFIRPSFNSDLTLLELLLLEGDGLEALARKAAAALLNAVSPYVNDPLSKARPPMLMHRGAGLIIILFCISVSFYTLLHLSAL
jgi:hypothetical protein